MPYAIESPGPTFNTLGTSTVTDADGKKSDVPLISVSGAPSYATTGSLDLLTVNLAGNPANRPSVFEVLTAWFNPDRAVIPMDVIFPPNISQADVDKENQAAMVDSQNEAIAAAFTHLGYDVSHVTVDKVLDGSPATGILEVGDVVQSINGTPVATIGQLRSAVADNGTEKPATLVVTRAGASVSVQVTPVLASLDGQTQVPVIKIIGAATYDFPFSVTIKLDDVGGPSAGMMFALGVLDKITPDDLTGGRHIAGSGTIDAAGVVGPIGGISKKMIGARNAGAEYMFVEKSNCSEAVGHVPDGLRVFSVSTLDDAIAALKVIAEPDSSTTRAAELDALPTCR